MADSDADQAYAAAQRLIAGAKANRAMELSFNRPETRALTTLPPEIGTLTTLKGLSLANTQVKDLTPLQSLSALEDLILNNTQVTDLSPLQDLTALAGLWLDNTQVADLAPLQDLTALYELSLDNTPVSDLAPLKNLSALKELYLDGTRVTDLTALQNLSALTTLIINRTNVANFTPLQSLKALGALALSNTQIANLSPLKHLTALNALDLDNTPITDLTPLHDLTALTALYCDNTQVTDLTPLRGLSGLTEDGLDPEYGLHFKNTAACRADPRIAEIAEIEDSAERARTLFAYLEDRVPPGDGAAAPQPDTLVYVLSEDDRLDVAASTPSLEERDERLKRVLFDRLKEKASALATAAGNRFFRLAARARGLEKHLESAFADADLLMIHLAVEDLRDYDSLGREEEDGEAFPPEVLVPLGDVLRIAPGLTLGHADVDLLVERANRRRAAPPVPEAEIAAQNAMSERLADSMDAVGERLRALAAQVAQSSSAEAKEVQTATNRNVLWFVAAYAAAEISGAAVGVVHDGLKQAILYLVSNHAAIFMQVAATYGAQFANWFSLSVAQLPDLSDAVRAQLAARPPRPKAKD